MSASKVKSRVEELSSLLGRVERATRADLELDAMICAHFRLLSKEAETERWAINWDGPVVARGGRIYLAHDDGATGLHCAARPVTASLDAALGLVERLLPGVFWNVGTCSTRGRQPYSADIAIGAGVEEPGATPALALLAALLRALLAEAQSHGDRGSK